MSMFTTLVIPILLAVTFPFVLKFSKLYLASEVFILKIVNPTTSIRPPHILTETASTVIYVVLGAPVIEEFLFRFLPVVALHIAGTVIPLVAMNIVWILGHYETLKSYCTVPRSIGLTMGTLYTSLSILLTLIACLGYNVSPALGFILPTVTHMVYNTICVLSELRGRLEVCRCGRYWRVCL